MLAGFAPGNAESMGRATQSAAIHSLYSTLLFSPFQAILGYLHWQRICQLNSEA